jgi:hypothetical protein
VYLHSSTVTYREKCEIKKMCCVRPRDSEIVSTLNERVKLTPESTLVTSTLSSIRIYRSKNANTCEVKFLLFFSVCFTMQIAIDLHHVVVLPNRWKWLTIPLTWNTRWSIIWFWLCHICVFLYFITSLLFGLLSFEQQIFLRFILPLIY